MTLTTSATAQGAKPCAFSHEAEDSCSIGTAHLHIDDFRVYEPVVVHAMVAPGGNRLFNQWSTASG